MGVGSHSLEIDSALASRLQSEAKLEGADLNSREAKRAAIFSALREGEERGYVGEAEARAWIRTWDSDAETPPPKAPLELAIVR